MSALRKPQESFKPKRKKPDFIFVSCFWRTPIGLPDWVLVSRKGDVFIKERYVSQGNIERKVCSRILKQTEQDGYRLVQFRINGKHFRFRVHRLVLLAFSGVDGGDLDVNHKNGVRDDNRIENLEWCTRSENLKHSYRVLGRRSAQKGNVSANKGKFNNINVSKAIIGLSSKGDVVAEFPSAAEASRKGFSGSGIRHCLIGDQKTSGGLMWRYRDS